MNTASPPLDARTLLRLRWFVHACTALAATIGLVVLLGWIIGNNSLKSLLPGMPVMMLNVALGMILAASALAGNRHRWWRVAVGVLLLLLGALTLAEYATGRDFLIDRIFRTDLWPNPIDMATPGRMAPHTAVGFVLLGPALALLSCSCYRCRAVSEILALCVALISLLALAGYCVGIANLVGMDYTKPIAPHTALGFLALSTGCLCARPDGTLSLILGSRGTSRLIWYTFGILTAMLLLLGIHSLSSLRIINLDLDKLSTVDRPRLAASRELDVRSRLFYQEVKSAAAGNNSAAERAATQAGRLEQNLDDYRRYAASDTQEQLAIRTTGLWKQVYTSATPILAPETPAPADSLPAVTRNYEELRAFIQEQVYPNSQATLQTATDHTHLILQSLGSITLALLLAAFATALITSAAVSRAVIHHEHQLTETTRQLTTLLQHLPGMAYRCKNDPRWPMDYVSDYAATLTGHPAKDIVSGRIAWGDLIHPDDRAAVWNAVQHGLEKKKPFHLEYRIRHADGSERTVWEKGSGIHDAAGNLLALEGFILDITERKRAEDSEQKLQAQIQQSQKMESLGVLAGGIAHDFNNLLTTILGHADLALHHLPPTSPARNLINEVIVGARQAADLTKQMLAYSGKGRFVVEPVNLSVLVEDLSRLLNISLPKKCAIRLNLAKDLPSVEADASQMSQIVMNLIINAAEAIGDNNGVISISTGVMHCDRAYLAGTYLDDRLPVGVYVYLEVSDSGCGMDVETLKKIYDPFFSTKFTGRGLGLSAVLGIVRGHKGAIRCYSEPGKGTTFKILFPASELPAPLPTSGPSAQPWRGHGTILVVDDEESVRTLARHMLEFMGFTVRTAASGRDALNQFREDPAIIRLVLLDLTMPDIDGEETFRELRRIRPDVCAVLSSGYNEQTATQRFVGKGLAAFIQKPYLFNQLQKTVQQALGEAPASRPPTAPT